VFATSTLERASTAHARPVIAGILTQQVEIDHQQLQIGIVTHARYIRETVDLLLGAPLPSMRADPQPVAQGVNTAARLARSPSPWRPFRWAETVLSSLRAEIEGLWRGLETLLTRAPRGQAATPAPLARAGHLRAA
jgi:hypothetical protein